MDCLFDEKSVDTIITVLPSGGGQSTDALYRELFCQSGYCLKKSGVLVVASKRPELVEKYAKIFEFKVVNKRNAGNPGFVFKLEH